MTAYEASQKIADSAYVFNVNIPSFGGNSQPPVDPNAEADAKKKQMYVVGGVLAILIVLVIYVSFKKKKA